MRKKRSQRNLPRTYRAVDVAETLNDHEARIRALEITHSRLLGALLFIAAEIPVVVSLVQMILAALTK